MKASCLRLLVLQWAALLLWHLTGAARLPLAYLPEVQAIEDSVNATGDVLLTSLVFPLYDKITPENIVPSLRSLFMEVDAGIDALEASAAPTWEGLLDPYERLGDRLNLAWGVLSHLQGVKNTDALRAAVDDVQDDNTRLNNRFSQSKPLYHAFSQLRNATNLTEVQERILDGILLNAKVSGVDIQVANLPGYNDTQSGQQAAMERFNDITVQLTTLSNNFSNNALDGTAAVTKLITEKSDLAGLPASFLAQAAAKASAANNINATADAGPWLITLDAPSYIAVITFADNRTLREEVYRAYITRGAVGDSDNGPVIESILALRHEQAQLVGYPNFAEYSMASKTATLNTALALLEQLRQASFDTAALELKTLRAFAASQNFSGTLMNWDVTYWAQKQQQALFNLTDEEVRPYFVYSNVLKGLFELGHRLFNATVEAADGEVPIWNPTVRFFKVYRNGELKAHLYIDPYARAGEKSAGAWMDGIVGQSALLASPGEEMRLPVAIIVTNQSPPVDGQPPLMTMDEVVTVFHEFGHAMQHTLTTQTDVLVAGIAGIEQDAVEQPSQMLERWPYEREVLYTFARHYETNVSMPEALYQKLVAARNYRSGSDSLRQIFYALMDLRIHSEYVPSANQTVEGSGVYKDVIAKTSVMAPLPEDRFLSSFTHIFSGGYAAGYYGYKWSQVMSLDGFSAFQEIGMNNTAAITQEGLRYRDTILAMGGGRDPALVFKDFRGRGPSSIPLLRDENLLRKGTTAADVRAESFDL